MGVFTIKCSECKTEFKANKETIVLLVDEAERALVYIQCPECNAMQDIYDER